MPEYKVIVGGVAIAFLISIATGLYISVENNKLYEKCLAAQVEISKTPVRDLYRTLDCSRR